MKTMITYYGGKQRLTPIIILLIPEHILYAEPFVGGAAVFFAKAPSNAEVLNDTNGELINFYYVVKEKFDLLYAMVSKTLHSRRQFDHAVLIYNYPDLFSDVQRAWAVWVLSNQAFSSKFDSTWGYDILVNNSARKISFNKLEFTSQYSKRLERVQLENCDALYIIKSRDSVDSFFYCDPPYFNSNLGHYKGYTESDYLLLLETLAHIEGKFLLSSYPSTALQEFVERYGWHQIQIEKTVIVNNRNGKTKPKTEVLTANYKLPEKPGEIKLF
ncbi:DNA adenine methylase [[Flexibacter] sp. ATCC 35208]|uniref:DNA adenine methylase n=1 Tax=[Flexibacter] sp. ATCC 35208 TaxID=1936242 RepID=UPI0009C6AE3F|nr:DNA adenine methylase [[Flexibacter] sp. ATCC 35208]OMP80164.1 methyltransferase [[Flexibacter] sp. ATCC 35208]